MNKLLFVCSKNKWRSPTGETVFAQEPSCETRSAGLAHDAEVRLSAEDISWADIIFVMEKVHLKKLCEQHARHLRDQRIVCLEIADDYQYMDAALVEIFRRKVLQYLR